MFEGLLIRRFPAIPSSLFTWLGQPFEVLNSEHRMTLLDHAAAIRKISYGHRTCS